MKTKLTLLLLFAASLANAQILYLDLGTSANDGTGDKLRPGGIKINTNFYWLSNFTASVSNYVGVASSNRVRVAAGTGGITVTPSGSGGVMTFTISDDDAGSGGSDAGGTNARQFGSLMLTNLSSTASNNVDYVTALTTLTNVANTASNRAWAADSWSTNRHAAAITNNHSAAVVIANSLQANSMSLNGGNLSSVNNISLGAAINFDALTASKFVATDGSKNSVSSSYGDTDIANLQGATNGLNSGKVTGPASAADNAIAVYDSTTGKLIKNSVAILSTSSNLTGLHNVTAAGTNTATAFVASGGPGSLQTDDAYINTNVHARSATLTNGLAVIPSTVSGVGGANTNFTLQKDSGLVYVDAATTNVNIVAIMGGEAGRQWRGTVIATNRGGTSRIFSLGATTNNFIALQTYDSATAPYTVTNAQALWFVWEMIGTNVYYAAKHMANPPN